MSFKSFLNEEIEVIAPKPNKIVFKINLREYKDLISKSFLPQTKKLILQRLSASNGDIPVFCEELNKFFIVNTNDKKFKATEAKSREDKELCGTLLNSMIIKEYHDGNKERMKQLTNLKIGWEIPTTVYTYKNEYGKNISLTNLV